MQIARGIRAGDETSTVKEEELRPASAMEEGRIFPLRRFSRTADMLRQSIVTWASMTFRKPTTDACSMRKGAAEWSGGGRSRMRAGLCANFAESREKYSEFRNFEVVYSV